MKFPIFVVNVTFDLAEFTLYTAGFVFAGLLVALSYSAYRNTRQKSLSYVVGAFSLIAIFLIYEYIEHSYHFNTPIADVVVPSILLSVLMLFFLSIVKKNR